MVGQQGWHRDDGKTKSSSKVTKHICSHASGVKLGGGDSNSERYFWGAGKWGRGKTTDDIGSHPETGKRCPLLNIDDVTHEDDERARNNDERRTRKTTTSLIWTDVVVIRCKNACDIVLTSV